MAKEEKAAKAEGKKEEAKAVRGIILNINGKEVRRVDYIRDLAKTGKYTRSEIKTMVSEAQGQDVPYQIVFAATKGLENVTWPEREKPVKEAKADKADAKAKKADKAA